KEQRSIRALGFSACARAPHILHRFHRGGRMLSFVNALAIALLAARGPSSIAPPVPDAPLDGLSWRLVGPHRAGWSTVVAGVVGRPDTFYFGAAGGGVWRAHDARRTRGPGFDHGSP